MKPKIVVVSSREMDGLIAERLTAALTRGTTSSRFSSLPATVVDGKRAGIRRPAPIDLGSRNSGAPHMRKASHPARAKAGPRPSDESTQSTQSSEPPSASTRGSHTTDSYDAMPSTPGDGPEPVETPAAATSKAFSVLSQPDARAFEEVLHPNATL
ncbi:hypothetical protein Q5752_007123 [Cryptotrichosporon argae]